MAAFSVSAFCVDPEGEIALAVLNDRKERPGLTIDLDCKTSCGF
jgi:hypothetical protein